METEPLNLLDKPAAIVPDAGVNSQPAKPNDENPGNPPKSKNNLRAKLAKATSSLFGFKKGGGRPKKCRQCNSAGCESCNFTGFVPGKLDAPAPDSGGDGAGNDSLSGAEEMGSVPGLAGAAAVPAPAADRGARFRRSVVSVVGTALGFLKGVVRSMAGEAKISPDFIEKKLGDTKEQEEAKQNFCDDLDAVMAKHNWQPEHAEEFALVCSTGRLLAPFGLMVWELRQEIARNRFNDDLREVEKLQLRRKQESEAAQRAAELEKLKAAEAGKVAPLFGGAE